VIEITESTILLGYNCNNNCVFCLYGKRKGNLSFEEIRNGLVELRKKSPSIMLTGGSAPRKDFFKILKYVKETGFVNVHIDTNGRIFSNKEFAKKVLEIYPHPIFSISLHSSNSEIHEKLTQSKDSWGETVNGIKNLVELGAYVCVVTLVCSLNHRELPKIVKFVKNIGAKEWFPILVRKEGSAEKIYPRLLISIDKIMPHLLEALRENIIIATTGFPLCVLPHIKYSYELRAIHSQKIIWHIDGSEVDEMKGRSNRKMKLPSCKDCMYFYMCEGILPEYTELYGTKEFSPIQGKKITSMADVEKLVKS